MKFIFDVRTFNEYFIYPTTILGKMTKIEFLESGVQPVALWPQMTSAVQTSRHAEKVILDRLWSSTIQVDLNESCNRLE